jgi:hypothetical protein
MVGVTGLEPVTLRLSSACSNQLSYTPMKSQIKRPRLVELRRVELPTPCLQSRCSATELQPRPPRPWSSKLARCKRTGRLKKTELCDKEGWPARPGLMTQAGLRRLDLRLRPKAETRLLLRKEVIQPQVPLRLPCYDFIPITSHTFGAYFLAVDTATSGTAGFHDVTGGVYKAWERIHGAVADAPLLAIPTSCRRVADDNLNWARFYGFAPPDGFAALCTGHCSTCAALAVRAILT